MRNVIAAATRVARRAVIVVSRGIDARLPPAVTVILRAWGAWLTEAVHVEVGDAGSLGATLERISNRMAEMLSTGAAR